MTLLRMAAALFVGGLTLVTARASTVQVEATPRQTMLYGMDFERLWFWNSLIPEERQRLARLAVDECRVHYVRVALNVGAERAEGQIAWEPAYRQILDCMRALRDARPEVKFFAIPRPIHEAVPGAPYTCFPLWITEFDDAGRIRKFHWDKAADIMVRHLRYVTGQGFKITYMDVKNECDKKIRPVEAARMIERMREQMGAEMPVVVAPSSHNYKAGYNWLREAVQKGVTNFFEIAATHNSRETGSLEDFVKLANEMGKPAWNTELHNWNGPDDLAVTNTRVLFAQIRAGVSGINEWLSLGNEIKTHKMFRSVNNRLEVMRRYYIFKKLVNTSGDGRYLPVELPEGLTSAVAFIRPPLMTVWLLNATAAPLDEVTVALKGHRITSPAIRLTWWDAENGREGSEGTLSPQSASSFRARLPPDSLTCFEFEADEGAEGSSTAAAPAGE